VDYFLKWSKARTKVRSVEIGSFGEANKSNEANMSNGIRLNDTVVVSCDLTVWSAVKNSYY